VDVCKTYHVHRFQTTRPDLPRRRESRRHPTQNKGMAQRARLFYSRRYCCSPVTVSIHLIASGTIALKSFPHFRFNILSMYLHFHLLLPTDLLENNFRTIGICRPALYNNNEVVICSPDSLHRSHMYDCTCVWPCICFNDRTVHYDGWLSPPDGGLNHSLRP